VSLVRIGGQLVDDERTCVVPGCDSRAPVEPYQAELPAKADELHRKAETYERLAKEARAEAEALSAEIETAQPHAFLCGGHKALLPPQLGGRAADEPGSQGETDTVAMTLAALYHEPAPAGL
jgi:hypothetical protein